MEREKVLMMRQARRRIIEICEYIYMRKWDVVRKFWNSLEPELAGIFVANEEGCKTLEQCRECINKGNYLRLWDLLVYAADFYIMEYLNGLGETDRRLLSEEAKEKNQEVLAEYHGKIFELVSKEKETSRIECIYVGTENVSISVKEENQFRLFSSVNPWRESAGLINGMDKGDSDEVCVLGFGGGYTISEIERKYCGAKIKVYLPNLDIFKAVLCHIPVDTMLLNENLELYSDPLCLDFFSTIGRKLNENRNFKYFIDRQELKAGIGNGEIAEKVLKEYQKIPKRNSVMEGKTGERIERYIKGLVING